MSKAESLKNYLNGNYTQQDKQILKRSGVLKIKKYNQSEVVRMIKDRDFKNCVPKKCEWCGRRVLIIHQHHFPIPKAQGGKDVVHICPTCHFEYHLLISGNYELTNNQVVMENG